MPIHVNAEQRAWLEILADASQAAEEALSIVEAIETVYLVNGTVNEDLVRVLGNTLQNLITVTGSPPRNESLPF